MPNIETYYKVLKILEFNNKDGIATSEFCRIGNVDYTSVKKILNLLLSENKATFDIRTRKWKLKK